MFTKTLPNQGPKYVFCMLWVRKLRPHLALVGENGKFVTCCGKMCQTSMSFTSFIGQAQTAIDGKGRSSFPREFRRQLEASDGKEFVVTRGPAQTLRLFTVPEYEKFMADLDSRSDRRQADLVRRSLWPTVVELDGQNRILLLTYKLAEKLLNYGILNATMPSMVLNLTMRLPHSTLRSMEKA